MLISFWSSFSHRVVKAVRKLNCGPSWEWALLQQWWTFTLRKLFGIISLTTSLDISPPPLLPTTTIPHHTRHVFLFLKYPLHWTSSIDPSRVKLPLKSVTLGKKIIHSLNMVKQKHQSSILSYFPNFIICSMHKPIVIAWFRGFVVIGKIWQWKGGGRGGRGEGIELEWIGALSCGHNKTQR